MASPFEELVELMEKIATASDSGELTVEERNLLLFAGYLKILDSRLIPSATSAISKVDYLIQKGGLHTALAKLKTRAEHRRAVNRALSAYKSAQVIANKKLAKTHPTRLALAHQFSQFYYTILNSPDRACNLAKKALDEAMSELDKLGEESLSTHSANTTMIMQLLRRNLTLWTSEMPPEMPPQRHKRNYLLYGACLLVSLSVYFLKMHQSRRTNSKI